MKTFKRNKLLVSLHVPKCGGTSLVQILKEWFNIGFHHHYIDVKHNRPPRMIGLKRYLRFIGYPTCVHGHFYNPEYWGLYDYYPECTQLITFLRDPVELHISGYFYRKMQIERGSFYWKGKRIEKLNYSSVDEWLEKVPMSKYKENLPIEIWDNPEKYIKERFIYVGIMEDYQKSLNELAIGLGMKKINVKRENQSIHNEKPSNSSIDYFNKIHIQEINLYNVALRHYNNFN